LQSFISPKTSDNLSNMNRFAVGIAIALLTFATGLCVTSQVNRAAYYIWPDVDPQPKGVLTIDCRR
jgi:hypothetical protein